MVYSLSNVVVTITNANYGTVTIGGGGKLVDTIGYSRAQDAFTVTGTADGGAVASNFKSKFGSISINLQQTSPHIAELTKFFVWCEENAQEAESSITINDNIGNLKCQANQCYPTRIPDNTMSATPTTRNFSFGAGEILPEEGNI